MVGIQIGSQQLPCGVLVLVGGREGGCGKLHSREGERKGGTGKKNKNP